MKIACLCVFRNASFHLREFLAHVTPYVDAALLLDDRSDEVESKLSRDLIQYYSKATTMIKRAGRSVEPFAFESSNRAILIREALTQGFDWCLCADVDERFELKFLQDLRGICGGATCDAYTLQVRDLWDSGSHYRVDGKWSEKRKICLFSMNAPGALLPVEGLHQPWIRARGVVADLGYNIFHLGSLTRELRAARVIRHESADPEHKCQPDYKYLADEYGLKLEIIPEGRGYQ